ncbi:uracil-DNA glycosylase [Carboxydochorda subterranea]|uniref:Type-5 uracil-DNA glycosylase n=1 Tax=Carboxydichorda subterranea TaxID=3109565 RepID=A0ABZ1C0E8_9FIRM|nr:uracil-DNA glycosylase [Limnochorda sp. L945t]WRP18256.1 uracil-DNA glycosylase [Limnochorda sp. L945t]
MPLHDGDAGWERLRERIVSCTACPRLVEYRTLVARTRRPAYASWSYWGRPVPGFGDPAARLVIVGLAPAAHGANRTGRMFTGDSSGDFLVGALFRAGFANQARSEHAEDGLRLIDAFMTAPVRCAPPDNRPLPEEMERCYPFLEQEMALLHRCRVILALGRIGFDVARRLLLSRAAHDPPARELLRHARFSHGATIEPGGDLPALVASYHPSRQNTQTGRLTAAMMDEVLARVRRLLQEADDQSGVRADRS